MKRCRICNLEKPLTDFAPRGYGRRRARCRVCDAPRLRDYYRGRRQSDPEYREAGAARTRAYRARNPEKIKAYRKAYAVEANAARVHLKMRDVARHLWRCARERARQKGILFTISKEDLHPIPSVCPVLGLVLGFGPRNSPTNYSIDRIEPARGYVPGNVCVISARANTLKQDASLDELRALARYVGDRLAPAATPTG